MQLLKRRKILLISSVLLLFLGSCSKNTNDKSINTEILPNNVLDNSVFETEDLNNIKGLISGNSSTIDDEHKKSISKGISSLGNRINESEKNTIMNCIKNKENIHFHKCKNALKTLLKRLEKMLDHEDEATLPKEPSVEVKILSEEKTIPEHEEEREKILEEEYNRIVRKNGLNKLEQELKIPDTKISNREYPNRIIQNTNDAKNILKDIELRLTKEGKIPRLLPYQPAIWDKDQSEIFDIVFDEKNNHFPIASASFDSQGNPFSIRVKGYNINDSIGASTIIVSTDSNKYRIESFEPTIEHLSLRKGHEITIPDLMPSIATNSISTCTDDATGDGSRDNPYKIYNFAQLDHYLRENVAAYFELACDIDASVTRLASYKAGEGFVPIKYFAGSLDAKNHKIQNLYINRPQERRVGLFAHLLGAKIKNLYIENAIVIGKYRVGILAGHMVRSLIDSVTATGRIQGAGEIGGLVGFQTSHFFAVDHLLAYISERYGVKILVPFRVAEIRNSHVNILVNCVRGREQKKNHRMCGGLVGWMGTGFVIQSSSKGNVIMSEQSVIGVSTVTIDGDMAGGLIGTIGTNENLHSLTIGADVFQKAKVYQSYSEANVYGGLTVGGLIGVVLRGGAVIAESYSTGNVEGHAILAGFIAMVEASYVVNCYTSSSIRMHYDDPDRESIPGVSSIFIHIFFGFSDSMASGTDHFSIWQRILARYLAASRFKIGVENSYADVSIVFLAERAVGPLNFFTNSITGSYFRLDGSIHSVVEGFHNLYGLMKYRSEKNFSVSFNDYTSILPLLNMKDIWSYFTFLDHSKNKHYQWYSLSNQEVQHIGLRRRDQLECPVFAGDHCKNTTTYTGWSDDIWEFTGRSLPLLENLPVSPF